MGWNSWRSGVGPGSYDKVMSVVEKLSSATASFNNKTLRNSGYIWLSMEDGWQEKHRDVNCRLVAKDGYPGGISNLSNSVHAQGFKLGIYSTGTHLTCGGNLGSLDMEETDAQTFVDWGVDFLKYDNCNINVKPVDSCVHASKKNRNDKYDYCVPDRPLKGTTPKSGSCDYPKLPQVCDWSTSNTAIRYNRMRDALTKAKPEDPIQFAMCIWGEANVFAWGNETGISWRVARDMLQKVGNNKTSPTWSRMTDVINIMSFRTHSSKFCGHNDADAMRFGEGFTPDEDQTQFVMWAAMKSPLFVSAFNQDEHFGAPAAPYKWGKNMDWTFDKDWPAEFWSGSSSNGTLVVMMNTQSSSVNKTAVWAEVPQLSSKKSYKPIDVFHDHVDLGCHAKSYTVPVPAHGTVAYMIEEC